MDLFKTELSIRTAYHRFRNAETAILYFGMAISVVEQHGIIASMRVIRGEGVPGSHLPFSPAVESGGFVFVSGQASVDAQGKIVRDTFEGEMRRSMDNLIAVLAGAGLTLADVVQVRSYVANKEDLAEYNRLYAEYFPPPMPARTTLIGVLADVLLFEIDVVAKTRDAK